jgi:catalase
MQGIKNLSADEATRLAGTDPDYATEDLFVSIKNGDFPSWKVHVQIMPEMEAEHYAVNPFDVTKVWPHGDYPLIEVGILELNRNPKNYFNEVEQAAFSPSNKVPGIGLSPDKMLQGRLFSYPDTQRYRLGGNYNSLPINKPDVEVHNGYRNGYMRFDENGGDSLNYEPSHYTVPTESPEMAEPPLKISGDADRYAYETDENSDFVQAGNLYRVLNESERKDLVTNIAGTLGKADKEIQNLQISHFKKADMEYGTEIEKAIADS